MCEACAGLLGPVADELLATYAKTQGLGPLEKGAVRNGQLQLQERYVLQVRPMRSVLGTSGVVVCRIRIGSSPAC